jgi:hypothetical protein
MLEPSKRHVQATEEMKKQLQECLLDIEGVLEGTTGKKGSEAKCVLKAELVVYFQRYLCCENL